MKKYCFIDMHMHSVFSNEEGCVQTPKEILEQVLDIIKEQREKDIDVLKKIIFENQNAYDIIVEKYGLDSDDEKAYLKSVLSGNDVEQMAKLVAEKFVRACISITDHNSILGSVNAIQEIKSNPSKYACIDFIAGVEFNAGLKDLGVNEQGNSIYSKCHLLAYDYDINDENLNIFSELFQLSIGSNNLNVGQNICATRNLLRKMYGVEIPLKTLKPLLEKAKQYQFTREKVVVRQKYKDIRTEFFDIVKQYLPKKVKLSDFLAICEKGIYPQTAKMCPENIGNGKLTIKEISDIVASAHGKTFVAHPTLITQNKHHCSSNKKLKEMLVDFLTRVKNTTGRKIDGIEVFHSSGTENLEVLFEIAEQFDMYVSGGSDNHGPTLHADNKISKCFGRRFEFHSVVIPALWPENIKNRVISTAFVQNKFGQSKPKTKQEIAVLNVDGTVFDKAKVIEISNTARHARKQQNQTQGAKNYQASKTKKKLSKQERKRLKREQRKRSRQNQNKNKKYEQKVEETLTEQPLVDGQKPPHVSNLKEYKKQWRREYVEEFIEEETTYNPPVDNSSSQWER